MAGQRIGELNGRWALMFKVTQAASMVFLPLLGWLLVSHIGLLKANAATEGNRWTSGDQARFVETLIQQFDGKADADAMADFMSEIRTDLKGVNESMAAVRENVAAMRAQVNSLAERQHEVK